jgi:2-oxoglutarate dehydrogenase E1 component
MVLCRSFLRDLAADDQEVVYIGRPEHSSPAEGDADSYKEAQAIVIENAVARK